MNRTIEYRLYHPKHGMSTTFNLWWDEIDFDCPLDGGLPVTIYPSDLVESMNIFRMSIIEQYTGLVEVTPEIRDNIPINTSKLKKVFESDIVENSLGEQFVIKWQSFGFVAIRKNRSSTKKNVLDLFDIELEGC